MSAAGMQSGSPMTVVAVPVPARAFENKIFTTVTGFNYVFINDKWLKHEASSDVGDNNVAMNAYFRKALSVENGVTVNAAFANFEELPRSVKKNAVNVSATVSLLGRIKSTVDGSELAKMLKETYDTFPIHEGTSWCVVLNNTPLRLDFTAITGTTGVTKDAFVAPGTEFTFEEQASPLLVFKPAATSRRAQIFNTNWSLSEMGIGGLDTQFDDIFRRAFSSHLIPPALRARLGVTHTKGMLLYGPPGTGKTLIARKIAEILKARPPKIVNGPEILNKFVGQAEENIRNLFADAIDDFKKNGDNADLHVIIFDEIDSICKARGSVQSGAGVHDTVVNQLLTMIDGIDTPDNFLVIGMTNRMDLIDEALLRPGRLEVKIEIALPDESGRVDILKIHTRKLTESNALGPDVDIADIAKRTRNFSGAELQGLVRSASSFAIGELVNLTNAGAEIPADSSVSVMMRHFDKALKEIIPAYGVAGNVLDAMVRGGLHGGFHVPVQDEMKKRITAAKARKGRITPLCIRGEPGVGKSTLAASLAQWANFPYTKVIVPNLLSGGEAAKVAQIRYAFEQATKSTESLLIFDNFETIIEYSDIGGIVRFSNAVMQAFMSELSSPSTQASKTTTVVFTVSNEAYNTLKLNRWLKLGVEMPMARVCDLAEIAVAQYKTFFGDAAAGKLKQRFAGHSSAVSTNTEGVVAAKVFTMSLPFDLNDLTADDVEMVIGGGMGDAEEVFSHMTHIANSM